MKKNGHECDLQSCLLCRLSLKDWIPAIATHKTNFFIKKGQPIFREGDRATGIHFIYSGTVKVHKKWDHEKELILRFARQGEILGHLALGEQPIYPVTATALETVVMCYIVMDFFYSTSQEIR